MLEKLKRFNITKPPPRDPKERQNKKHEIIFIWFKICFEVELYENLRYKFLTYYRFIIEIVWIFGRIND